MDIGRTQIMDGPGSVTRISVGQRITTVAGRISRITAGSGFREAILIGDRPGSRGEPVAITLAGRLCLHAARASFTKGSQSARAWTLNTISDRNITIFVTFVSLVNRSCGIVSFRRHRTLPTSLTP